MTTSSSIQQNVMRRVRTIHALRAAAGGAGLSFLALVASLYLIGREVWVARVWENMPSLAHTDAFLRFFAQAFLHTHLLVQALILVTIFAAVWLLRELGRVAFVFTTPKLAGA